MSWTDVMNDCLAEFERQTMQSLANIKTSLQHNGSLLNAEFRQYFLEASNNQIKRSYEQFEVDSVLEQQASDSSNDTLPKFVNFDRCLDSNSIKIERTSTPPNDINGASRIGDSSPDVFRGFNEDEVTHNVALTAINLDSLLSVDNNKVEQNINARSSDVVEGRSFIIRFQRIDPVLIEYYNKTGNKDTIQGKRNVVKEVEVNDDASEGLFPNPSNHPSSPNNNLPSGSNILNYAMETNDEQLVPIPSNLKKRFTCSVCEFSSNYKEHLKSHTRIHTGEKPYGCDRCGRRFTRAYSLKKHAATHTDDFPFHCKGCFCGFTLKVEKEAHERECNARRYECYVCKKFTTHCRTHLKVHMRSHNGEHPFQCNICTQRFTLKFNLNRHLNNIHNGNNV